MILIPEIETVLILTPRTGTKSIRKAVEARYPKSMMPYRHMEADGVPAGYDRWRRVGVVRHPVARLWSLYRYLRWMGGTRDGMGKWEPTYVARQRASVDRPFSEWIIENDIVFTSPYDSADGARFYPGFTVRHSQPENRKSQFIYLRPDLGTEVWKFSDLAALCRSLDLDVGHENRNEAVPTPQISNAAAEHVLRFMAWDLRAAATEDGLPI